MGSDLVESEGLLDLGGGEGAGEILLVREDQQGRAQQTLLHQQSRQLVGAVRHSPAARRPLLQRERGRGEDDGRGEGGRLERKVEELEPK